MPCTSGLLQRAPQQELDLTVQTAQVVIRPPLHVVQQVAIDAKKKGFALCHGRAR
jgi:hypothetical protein